MNPTFLIAEAGVNHNGSLELAKKLIEVAAQSSANAVKFQTFCTEQLLIENTSKAKYQIAKTSASETQYQMLKKLELTKEAHFILFNHAKKNNIQFLSTPFDFSSLDFLNQQLGLNLFKISSGEITNPPFLLQIARTLKPVILSTGMATLGEIETALSVLAYGYLYPDANYPNSKDLLACYRSPAGQHILQKNATLLHCTTDYPAAFADVNLKAMDTLSQAFNLRVGYSDHTTGIEIAIAAAARGATIIEKHFTLDKNLPGSDHEASITPDELTTMVRAIRHVEQALGQGVKIPTPAELANRDAARKSLVALCDIHKGERFTEKNLGTKRPGNGISGSEFGSWLGKIARASFQENELIHEK